MKFFNGTPKRKSQFLIWSTFKNLIHPVRSPDLLKTEELEKAVEERTLELKLANRKLIFQNNERGKRAAELIVANEELAFQSEEKSKRAAELILANLELVFQNGEKGKRAAELIIANNELAFQNEEKGKRAAELIIANTELAFQNEEKGKRAVELSTANTELIYQNEEKEKRAAELGIANLELVFQNKEKEKLAAELIVANEELAFQNGEKEKRAAELIIANTELLFQNDEKEKRAAELNIANTELVFQNEEKGRRAAELVAKNTELEAFSYVSSHDLQEPLRKIMMFSNMILRNESTHLSEKGMNFFNRIQSSAARMQQLIEDLLAFSSLNGTERKFEYTAISTIVEQIKEELKETIEEKNATIEITTLCDVNIISFQFRQVMHNLIGNALKFSDLHRPPYIVIKSHILKGAEANDRLLPEKEYCHLSIADNGIGFEEQYKDQIFEVFKGLHNRKQYPGTGIGLAIVKKVIDNHHGIITVTSRVNEGTTFHIYIPVSQ